MTVPFNTTPSNLRVPLFYAELDPSHANTEPQAQNTLLIGQMLGGGTWTPNLPVRVPSPGAAITGAGFGSILAAMAAMYMLNDPSAAVYALPVSDAGGATAATDTITITGPATQSGTLALYVAGVSIPVAVTYGDTATTIATNIAAAINASTGQAVSTMANCGLPCTATSAAGVVTLTARNAGLCGNDIDVRLNYRGSAAGEATPAGVTATIATPQFTGGATNPTITTALAALADHSYDFIVLAANDSATLNAVQAFLSDLAGRWSPLMQIYGGAWCAVRNTAGALATAGAARNDQHLEMVGFYDSPSPIWWWASYFAAIEAASLRNDPAQPVQFLQGQGLLAPPLQSRFPLTVRNTTLLYAGITTWTVSTSGVVTIENAITTYVTNAQGSPDNSYLEIETLYTLMYVIRALKSVVTTKYARVKLAADGTRLAPNSNVVTPSTIKADIIAAYIALETAGFVQESDVFSANLIVEKDATNPNRVNVLWPGILIDQLRVFATLIQFRLQ
ncbi:phage tail sheath subtilisin-like domain-containing protein [Novosphingobium sp. FSW06-99]|uniref:phage tail sheath subtilisin-like domain-containing protein n=1 Tax=Novosphingobium sp. FSW06-99 TaxID=1739113 RepID=UPI00076DD27F|nr:phage tail sheath subtilisin-like domain-containing protein [Novosphingobium sp. FSW06-99]KUR80759.1 phage tail protein [Novosphingobium sp. FSW06-99]